MIATNKNVYTSPITPLLSSRWACKTCPISNDFFFREHFAEMFTFANYTPIIHLHLQIVKKKIRICDKIFIENRKWGALCYLKLD